MASSPWTCFLRPIAGDIVSRALVPTLILAVAASVFAAGPPEPTPPPSAYKIGALHWPLYTQGTHFGWELIDPLKRWPDESGRTCGSMRNPTLMPEGPFQEGETRAMTIRKHEINHDGNWQLAFADEGSGDWRAKWFLDGDTATVENTPQGMILRAGPDIKDNGDSMVLWTRDSFVGDVKIEYEFTRHDRAVEGVNIIYLKATGIGTPPYDKDIAAWSNLRNRARMPLYFNYMNALHISYSVGLPDVEGEYIRARRYPAPVGVPFQKVTEVEGTHWGTGLFKLDVPYRLTVVSVGNVMTLNVCGDRREERFAWDVSKFPPLFEGRIGLRVMPCRISRIRNFKVYTR